MIQVVRVSLSRNLNLSFMFVEGEVCSCQADHKVVGFGVTEYSTPCSLCESRHTACNLTYVICFKACTSCRLNPRTCCVLWVSTMIYLSVALDWPVHHEGTMWRPVGRFASVRLLHDHVTGQQVLYRKWTGRWVKLKHACCGRPRSTRRTVELTKSIQWICN